MLACVAVVSFPGAWEVREIAKAKRAKKKASRVSHALGKETTASQAIRIKVCGSFLIECHLQLSYYEKINACCFRRNNNDVLDTKKRELGFSVRPQQLG